MAERLCYTVKNISVLTCAESSMAADSACLNGDKKSTEESVGTMKFNLMDNVVTRALAKICDMICLNVIWLICCIPIVTIGASTTALYSVMLKMVKNEEGYIFKSFFKAFKENFRQSTVIWLLFVLAGVIWWIDFNFAGALGGQAGLVLRVLFVLIGFVLVSVFIYAIPLTARYVNPVSATLKNALILTLGRLPYTVLMFAVTAGALIGSAWNTTTLMFALPMWFFFGGSLVAWINSCILRRVFVIFEGNEEDDNTKEEV